MVIDEEELAAAFDFFDVDKTVRAREHPTPARAQPPRWLLCPN